jgi:putative membrane protein
MKNKITILLTATKCTLLILAALMVSCGDSDKKETETKEEIIKEDINRKKKLEKETDVQFLSSAAKINMLEIKLGELAQTNSTMPDIKALGSMMQSDHSRLLTELKILASKKQIELPSALSEEENELYNNLKSKTGIDFNKDYSQAMVNGHKDAIAKFENASTNAMDPDIMTWATSILPILRIHLDHSLACQDKYNGVQR